MRPELDRQLEAAQAAVLERLAPGTRARRVRWSGGETRVLELGQGPPLVLVHGAFDSAALWAPILAALAARRRVLAVDLPGHGLADPFDFASSDPEAFAKTFVRDVLDELGLGAVDLVGCSFGGYVCTVFALEEPGRVSRLVLVGAPVGVARHVPRPLRLLSLALALPLVGGGLVRLVMSRPSRERTRALMGRIAVAHPERLDDEMLDADVLGQRRNRETNIAVARRLVTARGLRPQLILGERWHALGMPTAFVCGELDAFVSADVDEAWDAILAGNPGIRRVRIPDAGHLVWLDAPGAVAGAVEEFLAETPATGAARIVA